MLSSLPSNLVKIVVYFLDSYWYNISFNNGVLGVNMGKLEDKCSVEYLKECFECDFERGKLVWRLDRPKEHFKRESDWRGWLSQWAGREVGTVSSSREGKAVYIIVHVNGVRTTLHRILYIIYHGEYPEVVDHLDGDTLNNAISNLMGKTKAENSRNCKLYSSNTSGLSGVHYVKRWSKWKAQKPKGYIGYYDNLLDACCARISWLNSNDYTERHGR